MTTDSSEDGRRFAVSPAWVALAVSLLTIFYQVGVVSKSISENTRRVELLEAADRQRGDALGRIDARTARIEATLDIMRGGIGHPFAAPIPPLSDQGTAP